MRDPQPLVKMWTARRNGPSHFMQSCIPALLFVQRLAKNHRAYTNLSRFSPRVLSFWHANQAGRSWPLQMRAGDFLELYGPECPNDRLLGCR